MFALKSFTFLIFKLVELFFAQFSSAMYLRTFFNLNFKTNYKTVALDLNCSVE